MNSTSFTDGFVDRCQSIGVAPSALLKQAGVGSFLGKHDYLRSGLLGSLAVGIPGAFTATGPLDAYGRETAPSFSDRVAKMMKGLLLGGIAGVGMQAAMPYGPVRKRIAEKNATHGDKMDKRAFEQGYRDGLKRADMASDFAEGAVGAAPFGAVAGAIQGYRMGKPGKRALKILLGALIGTGMGTVGGGTGAVLGNALFSN